MVLNFNICNQMPIIYNAIKPCFRKEKIKNKIPAEVSFVLTMLKECSRLSVPKPFATGLIAVYVELCKGCKIVL